VVNVGVGVRVSECGIFGDIVSVVCDESGVVGVGVGVNVYGDV
jgi:hypothetical protein